MDDFIQEIPVYKNNVELCNVIKKVNLSNRYEDILLNIDKCYKQLVNKKILNQKELPLLKRWLIDINKIYPNLNKHK